MAVEFSISDQVRVKKSSVWFLILQCSQFSFISEIYFNFNNLIITEFLLKQEQQQTSENNRLNSLTEHATFLKPSYQLL